MCGIYLEEGRRCHRSQADARDEISGAKVRTGSCSGVEKRESESSWPRPSDEPPSGLDLLPHETTENTREEKTSEESIGTMTDLHFLVKQRRKKPNIPTRGAARLRTFSPQDGAAFRLGHEHLGWNTAGKPRANVPSS